MDVSAFDLATSPAKELVLGAIADAIWINGFKRSQKRTIQVSRPVRASAPVLYDRVTKVESFSFVAGQSFSDAAGGLAQMSTWPDKVPVLAHLRFKSGTDIEWLGNCGDRKSVV